MKTFFSFWIWTMLSITGEFVILGQYWAEITPLMRFVLIAAAMTLGWSSFDAWNETGARTSQRNPVNKRLNAHAITVFLFVVALNAMLRK
jgi:hypothetical protein